MTRAIRRACRRPRQGPAALLALAAATLVASMAVTSSASGASCTKTWNGGNGAWTDDAKWTPSGAPGSGDSVCITAAGTYTVALSTNVSIQSLTIGGPSTPGVQTLTVGPTLNFFIAGGTVDHSGALSTFGASTAVTSSASLVNNGAITLDGTGVGNAHPATLHLTAGTLTNSGTLTMTAGGASAAPPDLVATVSNTGTMDVKAPSSAEGGALDNRGVLKLADGASLSEGSTFTDDTGGQIQATGSGQLQMVSNGGVYDQGNGTTSGAQPVAVGVALNYTGTGKSTIVVPPGTNTALQGDLAAGQSLTIIGNSTAIASASFANAGTITLDGTGAGLNHPTLRLDTGAIANSGTITTRATGPSIGTPQLEASVTNSGTININTASIDDASPGLLINTGPLNLADGTVLQVHGTVINDTGGQINATGSGQMQMVSNNGVYDQGNGTTSGSQPVAAGVALDYTGTGDSTVVIPVATNTALQGNLASDQSLEIQGPSSAVTASAAFTNAGTIKLDATSGLHPVTLRLTSGALTNTGTIATQPSGAPVQAPELQVPIINSGTLSIGTSTFFDPAAGAALANAGTLLVAAGQLATCDDPTHSHGCGGFTQSAGTTTLAGAGATIVAPTFNLGGGTLSGTGQISGNLVSGGRVTPGARRG